MSFFYHHKICLIVLLNLSCLVVKSQPRESDTAEALVQYGSKYILGDDFYPTQNPALKIDSIIDLFPEINTELQFIKKHLFSNSSERMIIIDSLFASAPIRYDLITELERMIFYLKDAVADISQSDMDLTGNSEYPSNNIYQIWNTKKLWNQLEEKVDSSYLFPLTDKVKKYVHPICKTTIRKYGGAITSKQGWRDGKRHNGVDINCDQWDSVQCAFEGKVRFAKEFEGYGKVVVVRHYNGLETLYAHLAKIRVKSGQNIKAGDLIGLAGSTGNSEGSHLHFEIRFKDQVLNPENIIDFDKFELKSDSILLRKSGNGFVALPMDRLYHVIEKGDYPLKIATRYGMDVTSFNELNNITNKTKLKVGDHVIIK